MFRVFLAAVALMLLPCGAGARDIYTCDGPGGAKIFSQTPCGKNAKVAPMHELQTVGDSPAVREASEEAAKERDAAAKAAAESASKAPPTPAAPPPQEAYRCIVPNGEVFYRHAPCPESVEVVTTTWVGNTPVSLTRYAPVQSVDVSRDNACAAIRKPDKRFGQGRDESYDLFARREHRDPCGK